MKPPCDVNAVNTLCAKCLRQCKQPAANLLIECPRFYPMPFKVEQNRFDQMNLFGSDGGKKGKSRKT